MSQARTAFFRHVVDGLQGALGVRLHGPGVRLLAAAVLLPGVLVWCLPRPSCVLVLIKALISNKLLDLTHVRGHPTHRSMWTCGSASW